MDDIIGYPDRQVSFRNFQGHAGYAPTYRRFSGYIDAFHRHLAEHSAQGHLVEIGIGGWLQRADALKIYELARYSAGDVLEFGTYQGLSTYIIAKAIEASGAGRRVISMELSPEFWRLARLNLKALGVFDLTDLRCGDANDICRQLAREARQFEFIFVDHDHSYRPMLDACDRLIELLAPGGFALFHDYRDSKNLPPPYRGDPAEEYGVLAAVQERLPVDFEFIGCFGCTGLFRRSALRNFPSGA